MSNNPISLNLIDTLIDKSNVNIKDSLNHTPLFRAMQHYYRLTDDIIDKLIENPPAGSRVRALAVAGAFHTQYMQSAVSHVAGFVEKVSINEPTSQLLSNKDGSVAAGGKDAIDRIVNQIANPVRWDLCMESLVQLGVTGAIEFPPAGTLVGLLKRATPGIETFALKSPEDLAAAKEFAAKHGGA